MPITTKELKQKMVKCLENLALTENVNNENIQMMIRLGYDDKNELEARYFYLVNGLLKRNADNSVKDLDFGTEILGYRKGMIDLISLIKNKIKEAQKDASDYLIKRMGEKAIEYKCNIMFVSILLSPVITNNASIDFNVSVLNKSTIAESNLTLIDVFGD
jgi:hypothetical protein